MIHAIDWPGRAVAACLFGALALGAPMARASAWQLAQTASPPAATSAAPGANTTVRGPFGPVDARITDLHSKLRITAEQEPQFTALADVMRANARAMDTILEQRAKDTDSTAVNTVRWYARLTQAHADTVNKFVPAFEALYAVLSEGQRKTADAMFQHFAQRSPLSKSQ